MKKRDLYLMALGIGMGLLASGTFLKISSKPSESANVTDQMVIERARELGMVGIKEHIESNEKDEKAEESEKPISPKTIEITKGERGDSVIEKLVLNGLVEDGEDFSTFLENSGAENSFREGIYSIEPGSDYETILKILTSS